MGGSTATAGIDVDFNVDQENYLEKFRRKVKCGRCYVPQGFLVKGLVKEEVLVVLFIIMIIIIILKTVGNLISVSTIGREAGEENIGEHSEAPDVRGKADRLVRKDFRSWIMRMLVITMTMMMLITVVVMMMRICECFFFYATLNRVLG